LRHGSADYINGQLSGRPVRQGRAPLRRLGLLHLPGLLGVVPSAKDGLHCGRGITTASARVRPVVPSAKDGLHCGTLLIAVTWSDPAMSSRPPRTGSIAAAHSLA